MSSNMSESTRILRPVITRLTKREERQATKSVIAYLTDAIGSETEPHFRILGAELAIAKPPRPEMTPPRLIRVVVADYGNRRNLDFLVDDNGKVVQVDDLHGFQPAFHDAEIQEARDIAERDDRVARLAAMPGVFVSTFAPERTDDQRARLVGLRYVIAQDDHAAMPVARVVVDLSDRTLVAFEEVHIDE